ncbi:TRAP transporter small permease [Martelella soudanensis]|uniref:TRAP transporter small permease n=1 Tax=unclassified Martelella TaxID=2629616 RepID=UPI0015DF1C8D|nr:MULTISPECIES: TRAP transporter small permease [unclassified Martelella]
MTSRHELARSLPVRILRLVCEIALALIVASYAIITCAQVFYRFILNDSLVWSEELVRYGLLWGVMIGAAIAADRGLHIALAPLQGTVRAPAAVATMEWIVAAAVVLFCAIMGYAGWRYISQLWFMTSPAAQIPMRYVFAALPVGAVLISVFVVIHTIAGTYSLPRTDGNTEHPA